MKVQISDYSNYVAGKSSNGGCYGFWTVYEQAPFEKNGEPAFYAEHFTTADFEYCRFCGSFGSCDCENHQIITLTELQEEINEALTNPSQDIEVKYLEAELKEVDWLKVRRRIEDALRKTSKNSDLFTVATLLGVKIW